jgi:hypothetical protein
VRFYTTPKEHCTLSLKIFTSANSTPYNTSKNGTGFAIAVIKTFIRNQTWKDVA